MPRMDAQEIKQYRQEIAAKRRQVALKEISKLKPVKTVPIIRAILQESIDQCRSAQSADLSETLAFFEYANSVIAGFDERIKAFEKSKVFGLKKALSGLTHEKISGELNGLVERIATVKVTDDLLEMYAEAELWLQGWYLHTFNAAPKNSRGEPTREKKSGMYVPIDLEDRLFRAVVKMSQLEVAEYYGKTAEILSSKIAAHHEAKNSNNRAAKEAVGADVPSCLRESAPDDPAAGWQTILTQFADENDELKIYAIRYGIDTYGLTEAQNRLFVNLKERISSMLDSYINNPYVVPLTKISLASFFSRAHAELAKEAKNDVFQADDPAGMLSIIFDLRTQLVALSSDELLHKVNKLLLNAYTVMQKSPALHAAPSSAVR